MAVRPYRIRIEHGGAREGSVCIAESAAPMFSWAVAAKQGEAQAACRLAVALDGAGVWDSGWAETAEQSLRYAGEALQPGETYTLSVRLRDGAGGEDRPALQAFCPGRLDAWNAAWLCERDPRPDAVVSFVGDVECAGDIASACLFVCGLGYHRVFANGRAVFAHPLNPAFSEYEKRSYYTVIPGLESVLRKGWNRLGVEVAAGWRAQGNVCYQLSGRVPEFAGKTQLSAALRVRYASGRVEWSYTDQSWRCFYGPTASSNIFLGERYEAARRVEGWSEPGTAIPDLLAPDLADPPGERLRPQALEPVREQEVYAAQSVCEAAPGVYSADFGQNIAGVCRIRIPRGIPAGHVIEIFHMEYLNEDGRLYLPQLRNAKSVDSYVAAGDGRDPEFWQPRFTYHGFRYAEIKGWPGSPPLKADISAVSLYTHVAAGSVFACGSALVNRIYKNAVQTEKANIHSLLTDCPQRDERMGWLNDATVRFEATPYAFDIGRIFPKVVRDCMDAQDGEGAIACTAPYAFGSRPADPVCSSYLIAGWQAYLHTGNADILNEAYGGFSAWNAFLEGKSEGGILSYSYYGDWAAPAYACQSEESAVSAVTPGALMSTGYFYFNARLLAQMARIIGRQGDAQAHLGRAAKIREAFLSKWWDASAGRVGTGSQGCQSFALWLGILPEDGRQKAADCLHRDLVERDFMFTTGNLCTRYMMEALTRYGYLEDAWTLALREAYPSIGFMVQNEATTVWERFELKKNPTMNSHNHPMYGAVSYWYYAYLAGVRPTAAGWQEFDVSPFMPQKLLSASAVVETPYGDVAVRWARRYGAAHLYLSVPHGATARVALPWGGQETAGHGFHHWSGGEPAPAAPARAEGGEPAGKDAVRAV
jgi:alpha-L-rhamnosidase